MTAIRFSQSVSGEIADGILVVTIDNPPVNALSAHVRQGLAEALAHASAQGVAGMVLTGAGRTFIAGADIREFGQPVAEPTLPDLVERIETFDKPVVAAINGAALGGGLEIALGCHGRVAGEKAIFGLPEVKLGIVPGAGGTQRLPRLIGMEQAIDLIGRGRTIKAVEAAELGLVDAVAADDCVDAARASVRTLAGAPLRRTGMMNVPASDGALVEAAVKRVLAKARGQAAPAEAVRLVQLAGEVDLRRGLAEERATFLRLRDSHESAALRHVFFAERAAGRVEGLDTAIAREIATVGIAGTGLMGAGIAAAALAAGYRVIGLEQTPEAAQQGLQRIAALLDRTVKSGRMTQAARERCLAELTVTADANALAAADLVIDAVFDDLAIKIELFKRLDGIVRRDAILATNTSYLDPDTIAAATANPGRVLGLHFFSPANIMRLVEVVDCAATAPDVLATGLAFAKRLGKLAIVCRVTEGFIGNRIFSAYRREAEFMLEEGAMPQEIDAALEGYGFPMGIFAVSDMAGLEIAWARRKRQAATRDPDERYVAIADRLCEAGRLGVKSGRGWYDYSSGERAVDPQVNALIEEARQASKLAPRTFTPDEIVARLLSAMAVEGAALLSEGIAARSSDIDLVMINGYGFPAHKGGPMFVAENSLR